MKLQTLLAQVDSRTAQTFVSAARHVIDAMLIEAARVEQTATPKRTDYENAALSRETAPGGWLSHEALRETSQRLAEAIAGEKWTEGMLTSIRLLSGMGG